MKYRQFFRVNLLCLLPIFTILANSKEQLFYDAVRLEATGNIDLAIENYEKITNQASSANLHGNLANLYFKKSDYSRSILHYRKALLLDANNREFISNLAYVCSIANVQNTEHPRHLMIGGFSANFWKGLLILFIWCGLFLISFLFFRRVAGKSITFVCLAWLGGVLPLALIVFYSSKQENLAERQVIALLHKGNDDTNASASVALRRFAASSSTANASVRPGESLFVNESQLGGFQSHQGKNAQNWLLVRSADSLKKGWVQRDEVGWVVQN